ncbi:unnamed protein product [Caenorhabditis nigoni]
MHRIPIQSFPDVVNQEILRIMKPSEVFLASRTSEKTKILIKRNIYRVDEVGVKIARKHYGIRAAVYFQIGRKSCDVVGFDYKNHKNLCYFYDWQVYKEYQFLENMVIIPMLTNLFLASSWPPTRLQIHSIHSYICDVFNIDASQLSVKFQSEIYHEFFDVGTVKKCTMTDVELESHRSMELSNHHKNINLLIVETTQQIAQFGSKDYYRHNCFLTDFYVKALLKLWSENKMDNLVSMIAYQASQRPFDYEKVLEVLEERVKNSEASILNALQVEKPSEKRIYPYKSIITQEHQFEADTFDCDGGYDVVRNSDGKRATIKISKDYFMCFVWP